ncbi:beta-1,3-galactosyltransferase 1-like [Eleginops maclovinus]|uniref:beta-1,3-galactosyltransferase 1-like n=1 Tax=Eleginops maclovinus TaxID=56733 RepID=UPI0030807670
MEQVYEQLWSAGREMQNRGSGGDGLRRQLKRLWLNHGLRYLLLCCLALLVWLSSNSLSWWDGFPLKDHNQWFVNTVQRPPSYRDRSNNTFEPIKTTEGSTVPPNVPRPVSTTLPPKGLQFHQAYPRNYHFIMDNKEVCKTKTPLLVLLVPVAPKNVAARDAIRQTWGSSSEVRGDVVLTLFMLGLYRAADVDVVQEKLQQENLLHHDLIQSDFLDTYLNLTIKTMVIMDWLVTRCPEAAYAMKVDSDIFLNIDNLVMMLQKPDIPKLNYLTGMLMWHRPVIRSKSSKWYVPVEMYPEPFYPTYTLGMGYVFSNDLPKKIVEASKSVNHFTIEDAYVGACMKKLGLSPRPPPNPSQFRAYNQKYDRCQYSKIITYILGSPKQLVDYWTDLKRPEPPC